jgi:pimeloyl-ACP methyl ester carboxylesterase
MGQAWAVGHSWGGHLALHLAVAHPDRIAGLVCLNALGAYGDGLQEFSQNLRARIPAEDAARVDTLTGRERLGLLWPGYFADPASAPAMPGWELSTECAEETWASIEEHFERGTLAGALPRLEVPTLLIHGVEDPFPAYVSQRTAALMPNARLEELPARGHFPWLEQPGQVRSLVEGFVG